MSGKKISVTTEDIEGYQAKIKAIANQVNEAHQALQAVAKTPFYKNGQAADAVSKLPNGADKVAVLLNQYGTLFNYLGEVNIQMTAADQQAAQITAQNK